MEDNTKFIYRYSAKENREIQEIRQKYLPCEENKLEELRRLDNTVQLSGTAESLISGIGGALVFGLGLCLAMQIIGEGLLIALLGGLLCAVGTVGLLAAYPIHRKVFNKTKRKLTPRILELTAELSGEKF